MIERFKKTGTVATKMPPGPVKSQCTEENIARVKELNKETPGNSIRKMATMLNLNRDVVWNILRKEVK